MLVMVSTLGWKKQKAKIEEARRYRAMQHSSARAKLVGEKSKVAESVAITGVMRLQDTVLVGYRKSYRAGGGLVPGEKLDASGVVTGTWMALLDTGDPSDLEKLDTWCKDKVQVVLRVDPGSSSICFVEPLSSVQAKLQLAPG